MDDQLSGDFSALHSMKQLRHCLCELLVLLRFFPYPLYMSLKTITLGVKQPQWLDSEQNLFVLPSPVTYAQDQTVIRKLEFTYIQI